MSKAHIGARTDAETMRRLEPIVAAYPHVKAEDLDFLLHWYRKEASSYDVGILSTNTLAHDGYARFRRDHIDRLTALDYVKALFWIAVVCGLFIGIFSLK